jgi:hypothetical protein
MNGSLIGALIVLAGMLTVFTLLISIIAGLSKYIGYTPKSKLQKEAQRENYRVLRSGAIAHILIRYTDGSALVRIEEPDHMPKIRFRVLEEYEWLLVGDTLQPGSFEQYHDEIGQYSTLREAQKRAARIRWVNPSPI